MTKGPNSGVGPEDTCQQSGFSDEVASVNIRGSHTLRSVQHSFFVRASKLVATIGGARGISLLILRQGKAEVRKVRWHSDDGERHMVFLLVLGGSVK